MKTPFRICILFAFTGILMNSCEKEAATPAAANVTNQTSPEDDFLYSENSGNKVPVIYYATWEEWGRASKDCKGWGLCNFEDCWFCDPDELTGVNHGQVTYDNETGVGFLVIELNPNDPKQNMAIQNHTTLKVDYDIVNESSMMHAGQYPFESSIGEFGGYTVHMTIEI